MADDAPRVATSTSPSAAGSILILSLLLALVALLFVLDLGTGSVSIPAQKAFQSLIGQGSGNEAWDKIIQLFRIPKALTALIAGACLAVSGLLLQTLFSNPLAGPDILGTNAGASIAVALVILAAGQSGGSSFLGSLGLAGSTLLALAASLGAAAVLALVLLISLRAEGPHSVLIIGLLIGFMAGSVVSFLVYFALPQKVPVYLAWTYGSFQSLRRAQLPALGGIGLLGLALALAQAKSLDALLLGERYTQSLGINVKASRSLIVVTAALLCGTVTAFCGPIAFLGIAAPHAARGLMRSQRHLILLPAAALCGSILALGADILTQLPRSGALLPLNPLLALVGAPLILFIVLGRPKRGLL